MTKVLKLRNTTTTPTSSDLTLTFLFFLCDYRNVIETDPITFPSVEQRNDTHDAVKGRAQALSEDTDELRALFDVGQTLAYIEKNEPPNHTLLDIKFKFEKEEEYQRAVEHLVNQSDDDLEWLGQQLQSADTKPVNTDDEEQP